MEEQPSTSQALPTTVSWEHSSVDISNEAPDQNEFSENPMEAETLSPTLPPNNYENFDNPIEQEQGQIPSLFGEVTRIPTGCELCENMRNSCRRIMDSFYLMAKRSANYEQIKEENTNIKRQLGDTNKFVEDRLKDVFTLQTELSTLKVDAGQAKQREQDLLKQISILEVKAKESREHANAANEWREKYIRSVSVAEKLQQKRMELDKKLKDVIDIAAANKKKKEECERQSDTLKREKKEILQWSNQAKKSMPKIFQLLDEIAQNMNSFPTGLSKKLEKIRTGPSRNILLGFDNQADNSGSDDDALELENILRQSNASMRSATPVGERKAVVPTCPREFIEEDDSPVFPNDNSQDAYPVVPTKPVRIAHHQRVKIKGRSEVTKTNPFETEKHIMQQVQSKLGSGVVQPMQDDTPKLVPPPQIVNTIHGKKSKTIREIQEEQKGKGTIKERVAELKRQKELQLLNRASTSNEGSSFDLTPISANISLPSMKQTSPFSLKTSESLPDATSKKHVIDRFNFENPPVKSIANTVSDPCVASTSFSNLTLDVDANLPTCSFDATTSYSVADDLNISMSDAGSNHEEDQSISNILPESEPSTVSLNTMDFECSIERTTQDFSKHSEVQSSEVLSNEKSEASISSMIETSAGAVNVEISAESLTSIWTEGARRALNIIHEIEKELQPPLENISLKPTWKQKEKSLISLSNPNSNESFGQPSAQSSPKKSKEDERRVKQLNPGSSLQFSPESSEQAPGSNSQVLLQEKDKSIQQSEMVEKNVPYPIPPRRISHKKTIEAQNAPDVTVKKSAIHPKNQGTDGKSLPAEKPSTMPTFHQLKTKEWKKDRSNVKKFASEETVAEHLCINKPEESVISKIRGKAALTIAEPMRVLPFEKHPPPRRAMNTSAPSLCISSKDAVPSKDALPSSMESGSAKEARPVTPSKNHPKSDTRVQVMAPAESELVVLRRNTRTRVTASKKAAAEEISDVNKPDHMLSIEIEQPASSKVEKSKECNLPDADTDSDTALDTDAFVPSTRKARTAPLSANIAPTTNATSLTSSKSLENSTNNFSSTVKSITSKMKNGAGKVASAHNSLSDKLVVTVSCPEISNAVGIEDSVFSTSYSATTIDQNVASKTSPPLDDTESSLSIEEPSLVDTPTCSPAVECTFESQGDQQGTSVPHEISHASDDLFDETEDIPNNPCPVDLNSSQEDVLQMAFDDLSDTDEEPTTTSSMKIPDNTFDNTAETDKEKSRPVIAEKTAVAPKQRRTSLAQAKRQPPHKESLPAKVTVLSKEKAPLKESAPAKESVPPKVSNPPKESTALQKVTVPAKPAVTVSARPPRHVDITYLNKFTQSLGRGGRLTRPKAPSTSTRTKSSVKPPAPEAASAVEAIAPSEVDSSTNRRTRKRPVVLSEAPAIVPPVKRGRKSKAEISIPGERDEIAQAKTFFLNAGLHLIGMRSSKENVVASVLETFLSKGETELIGQLPVESLGEVLVDICFRMKTVDLFHQVKLAFQEQNVNKEIRNKEEEHILEYAYQLANGNIFLSFTKSLVNRVCIQESIDTNQCAAYTRLLSHALAFEANYTEEEGKASDADKNSLIRTFLDTILWKHKSLIGHSLIFWLLGKSWDSLRFLAEEEVYQKAIVSNLEKFERDIVKWAWDSRFGEQNSLISFDVTEKLKEWIYTEHENIKYWIQDESCFTVNDKKEIIYSPEFLQSLKLLSLFYSSPSLPKEVIDGYRLEHNNSFEQSISDLYFAFTSEDSNALFADTLNSKGRNLSKEQVFTICTNMKVFECIAGYTFLEKDQNVSRRSLEVIARTLHPIRQVRNILLEEPDHRHSTLLVPFIKMYIQFAQVFTSHVI